MSEEHQQDPRKHAYGHPGRPKQLIVVIGAAFIVPIIVIIMLTQFVTPSRTRQEPGHASFTRRAIARASRSVASWTLKDAPMQPVVLQEPARKSYEAQCQPLPPPPACSAAKFGDPPRPGDPRVTKGFDDAMMFRSALHGKGSLPEAAEGRRLLRLLSARPRAVVTWQGQGRRDVRRAEAPPPDGRPRVRKRPPKRARRAQQSAAETGRVEVSPAAGTEAHAGRISRSGTARARTSRAAVAADSGKRSRHGVERRRSRVPQGPALDRGGGWPQVRV